MDVEDITSDSNTPQAFVSDFSTFTSSSINNNQNLFNSFNGQNLFFSNQQPGTSSTGGSLFSFNSMFPQANSLSFFQQQQPQFQQSQMFSLQNQGIDFSLTKAPYGSGQNEELFLNNHNTGQSMNDDEDKDDKEFRPEDVVEIESEEYEDSGYDQDEGGDYIQDPNFDLHDYFNFRESIVDD